MLRSVTKITDIVAVNDFSGGVRDHYTTLTNLKQLFFNHEL